jgi:hypothetical protein
MRNCFLSLLLTAGLAVFSSQVLDPGKISAASSNTAPTYFEIRSNGEEAETLWQWQGNRKEGAEQVESSFEVSLDDSWLVINCHVSTGGYLQFARRNEEDIYTFDGGIGDQNDGGVSALAFKQNGLNTEDYMGDHFSYSFSGWADTPNRIMRSTRPMRVMERPFTTRR